ncbi:hypothetical protein [Anaeromicropila populeti]|nr:hypothetical protein [Anaeromicropila populeti]
MAQSQVKSKIAKATGTNPKLNKKAMEFKKSWDQVDSILQSLGKHNKKGK